MTKIQQKPIIHGRDHMPGGADPIPGFSGAAGDFETVVHSIDGLYAYWRLGETSGPWRDTSGVDPADDLTEHGSGLAFTPDVAGALTVGDDGAVQFNYDGTSSTGGRYLGSGTWKDYRLSGGQMTVAVWAKTKASAGTRRGHIIGNSATGGDDSMTGWGLHVMYPGREIRFTRGQVAGAGSPEAYAETVGGVVADEWNLFVGTYDGATIKLYANGALVAAAADTSGVATGGDEEIRVGYSITQYVAGAFKHSWLYGSVDEAAVWTRALTPDEIAKLYSGGTTGLLPPAPGSGWQFPPPPPGGDPVGVVPPSGWTGGTDPGGYHYQAHVETVVLTDSSPGRFDVPPRTWTRIPFNHITIQRQFQPSPGYAGARTVLLPDDRGLSNAAQNGVLLLPDAAYEVGDPTPEQQVWAWCNPEYPILDGDRLPNYTAPPWSGAPDRYCRALRIRNVSTGNILRDYAFEAGQWRVFFEWPFADAGEPEGLSMSTNDNPFPKYPHWAARPMHKSLPYPELPGGISEWLNYYHNVFGYSRWLPIGAYHHWDPGTKFVAEVWQDTPYLLRFTTAVYPHHEGIAVTPGWVGWEDEIGVYNLHQQPYLTVSYPFNPATIDHATGTLL
jgi:hypothetical protein